MYSAFVKWFEAVAVAGLVLTLAACGGEESTPEQRVRHLIDAAEQAIESGDLRRLQDTLHLRYSDTRHRNRAAAMGTLFALLRRHDNVHLFTVIRSVSPVPDRDDAASAVVYVAMTAVPIESVDALISLKADLYRFDIGFVKEDGDWRIRESRWERVDPAVL